jgi:tRNA 2-thiouridine synthesizing protein A
MATDQLDAKGLICPLPVLKARRAMKALAAGDVLEIEATDPGSVKDFDHFCETTGYRLISSSEADGVYHFAIEKTG